MTITTAQFAELSGIMRRYVYRHQFEGRGPDCHACLRVAPGHSSKDQPICLTVNELLWEIEQYMGKEAEESDAQRITK